MRQASSNAASTVRNQSVLIRGVNDDPATMQLLVKRLSWINVHPYYVYMHRSRQRRRRSAHDGADVGRHREIRAAARPPDFNTPLFICDGAPAGGRQARRAQASITTIARNGIAVYSAPSVKPGRHFVYFDPIETLVRGDARERVGTTRAIAEEMIDEAIARRPAAPGATYPRRTEVGREPRERSAPSRTLPALAVVFAR